MKVKSIFNSFDARVNIFIFFIFFLFILIVVRLFYLQILHSEDYKNQAEDQYVYDSGDTFDRGNIYFKDNKNSLAVAAQMSSQYDIAIDPRVIKKSSSASSSGEVLYLELKSIFEEEKSKSSLVSTSTSEINLISQEEFKNKLNQDSAFEIIANNVSQDISNKIISKHLKGVIVNRKKTRYYPESEDAAKTLGFVGYNSNQNQKTGLYGLEKYYNDILNRSTNSVKVNFFAEVFADLQNNDFIQASSTIDNLNSQNLSGDLNLTIDIGVQRFLHETLGLAKEK